MHVIPVWYEGEVILYLWGYQGYTLNYMKFDNFGLWKHVLYSVKPWNILAVIFNKIFSINLRAEAKCVGDY